MNMSPAPMPFNLARVWNPVSAFRPDDDRLVLVTNGKGYAIARWCDLLGTGGGFGVVTARRYCRLALTLVEVTHWQELPEMPQ